MLTIEDIKNASFRRANFGGYKPEDVDAFIDDVQISFEQMIKEREELNKVIKNLNRKIEKFKEEDASIKNVILNAQQVAEDSLNNAKEKTETMINDATKQSEKMINEAKKEVSINNEISERIKAESIRLKKHLAEIYQKHLKIIDEIPGELTETATAPVSASTVSKSVPVKKSVRTSSVDINKRFSNVDSDFLNSSSTQNIKHKEKTPQSGVVTINDIFSSEDIVHHNKKFNDLQFGKKFNLEDLSSDEEQKSPTNTGAYAGLFKNK